jgi:ribosome maturation factor RimP
MSRAPSRLQELIAPVVAALGYELVGVEHVPQGRRSVLRLYIDGDDGITVDDCERVSRQVSALLDVEDPIAGEYLLEVSSPGLDRPLFTAEHFQRFAGHPVRLRLTIPMEGRRHFSGTLQGLRDDHVVLLVDGVEVELPLAKIDKANLVPEL